MTDTVKKSLGYIEEYMHSLNAATGSKFDGNANVTNLNINTLSGELTKKNYIDINRGIMEKYLTIEGDTSLFDSYMDDLKNHRIYRHDETTIYPYCCSISLYPYVLNGTKDIGGTSTAPTCTNSFIGGLINLIYEVSCQFAGAVAVPEFLCYFDHFLRGDYGEDYTEHLDEMVEVYGKRTRTLQQKIEDWFQQFVHSINAPAGARNYQSPFTNIAYFDSNYFNSIFENFVFPDGDEPSWKTTSVLQKLYMKWFNKERTKDILTFPVESANLLCETGNYKDEDTADFVAEMWSEGHSFFMYQSDSVDALASCCFSKEQRIAVKKYNGESFNGTFEELHDYVKETGRNTFYVYYEEKMRPCHLIMLPNRPMYKIELVNNSVLTVSDNHLNPTQRGDVVTTELTEEDYLRITPEFVGHADGVYCIQVEDKFFVKIRSIVGVNYDDNIYCLEMEDQTTPYFMLANGIITHNCRLRNAVEENVFSYTLGAGGIQTGSKCVITLNLNRITQDWYNGGMEKPLSDAITDITKRVHKYLDGWNKWLWHCYDNGMLPIYSAGFIDLDKQYLTVGVNGFVEAAEFLNRHNVSGYEGIEVNPYNDKYKKLAQDVLGTIKKCNTEDRTEHCRFNTEMVPGENAAVKLYSWDKADGYEVPSDRNIYNSYFFIVENEHTTPIDKFYFQGNGFASECDGGVANHINLSEHLSKAQYRKLMDVAATAGCNYFTFNIPNTCCNNPDCGHIDKRYLKSCPVCGSTDVDYATRIIGYLKKISNFSTPRQIEANRRFNAGPDSLVALDD